MLMTYERKVNSVQDGGNITNGLERRIDLWSGSREGVSYKIDVSLAERRSDQNNVYSLPSDGDCPKNYIPEYCETRNNAKR